MQQAPLQVHNVQDSPMEVFVPALRTQRAAVADILSLVWRIRSAWKLGRN
jgi:hypothetical protein